MKRIRWYFCAALAGQQKSDSVEHSRLRLMKFYPMEEDYMPTLQRALFAVLVLALFSLAIAQ